MSDVFGEPMKVREAIALLAYGTNYEIKGAYSGKIYHRSWVNKEEHAEKFYDETTANNPFYATGRMSEITGTAYFSPVIGIWVRDYYLRNKPQTEGESEAEIYCSPSPEEVAESFMRSVAAVEDQLKEGTKRRGRK